MICDIATVGATAHSPHLALHVGLTGVVSFEDVLFLALGLRANRRSHRELAVRFAGPSRGTSAG